MLAQVILNGLVTGLIYVLVALGLAVVFSIGGVLNFAHGGMCMLGGFFLYGFFQQLGLYFPLALLLSSICVAVLAILIERIVVHRLLGEFQGIVIAMLGLTLILSGGAMVIFGEQDKIIQSQSQGVMSLHGVYLSNEKLIIAGLSIALMLGLYSFLKRTKIGQALRAVGQDSAAASYVGVDAAKYSTISFAIAGFLAGVAGALVGVLFLVSPFMDMFFLLKGVTVIMIGGLGSMAGAVLGGLLLGTLESFTLTFIGPLGELITFAVLIVVILFRPTGLLGHE